jgi:hypothetical protein
MSRYHFGSCFTKNSISTLYNRKDTFCQMKRKPASMALLAVPRNTRMYDMRLFRQTIPLSGPWLSGPWPSSFDLKSMQSRTWYLITLKGLYRKMCILVLILFPELRHINNATRMSHIFFDFSWISYVRFETCMKWRRTNTPARDQAMQSTVRTDKVLWSKMMLCGSKNDFRKKSRAHLAAW